VGQRAVPGALQDIFALRQSTETMRTMLRQAPDGDDSA
jgi:hypothetical protein